MKTKKYLVSAAIGSALLLATVTVSTLPTGPARSSAAQPSSAVIADSGDPTPTPTATPDPSPPNGNCQGSGNCGD